MKTTSLELSQRLKVLGVPQVSTFYYGYPCCEEHTPELELHAPEYDVLGYTQDYSSYSSDELGEWLPFSFKRGEKDCTWEFYKDTKGGWECWVNEHDGSGHSYTYAKQQADTLAEAMGMMMEYLIINGYIKVEELK